MSVPDNEGDSDGGDGLLGSAHVEGATGRLVGGQGVKSSTVHIIDYVFLKKKISNILE